MNKLISTEGTLMNVGIENGGRIHFIKQFLKVKSMKSSNTSESYERDIKDFFNVSSVEEISLDRIRAVNIFMVEQYILNMEEKKLSSATINRKVSSLSSLYKWLMKYEDNYSGFQIIKFNPFGNLKDEKPPVNNKETEFLTEEECKKLISSIDTSTILGIRNKAIISLAITTALRKSEIINIKISDIGKSGEYDIIKVIRKGNKKDVVKLQPKVKQLIEKYISETKREGSEHKDEYLFIGHSSNGRNKEKLNQSTLNYMLTNACKRAGIDKKLKVHSTRHTAITIAITKGATIEKVREFAAHKNIATTNRYVHSIDRLKDNPGDNMDIV